MFIEKKGNNFETLNTIASEITIIIFSPNHKLVYWYSDSDCTESLMTLKGAQIKRKCLLKKIKNKK